MNEMQKNKLKEQLIEIYQRYLQDVNDSHTKAMAQKIFFEYVYASESMDKDLINAVSGLEHIGWEYSRSTKSAERDWKMRSENARKILEDLKISKRNF